MVMITKHLDVTAQRMLKRDSDLCEMVGMTIRKIMTGNDVP